MWRRNRQRTYCKHPCLTGTGFGVSVSILMLHSLFAHDKFLVLLARWQNNTLYSLSLNCDWNRYPKLCGYMKYSKHTRLVRLTVHWHRNSLLLLALLANMNQLDLNSHFFCFVHAKLKFKPDFCFCLKTTSTRSYCFQLAFYDDFRLGFYRMSNFNENSWNRLSQTSNINGCENIEIGEIIKNVKHLNCGNQKYIDK